MKIVVLDGYTVNPGDLSWAPLEALGELTVYDRTKPADIVERCLGASAVVVNKVRIGAVEMEALPALRGVFLLASGYDNVDVEAARQRHVRVYNAVGYGTDSVAQHTMSLILAMTNRVETHHHSVLSGHWSAQEDFSYTLLTVSELAGKTLGIIGFGKIGRRVGELAAAFGMTILYSGGSTRPSPGAVDLPTLFSQSDFITLHAPLNDATRYLINRETLALMKSSAKLINTGRGALIDETALLDALVERRIAGAALDVLTFEPPHHDHPLFSAPGVLVTPHMAWSSVEARRRLLEIVAANIARLSADDLTNRVV